MITIVVDVDDTKKKMMMNEKNNKTIVNVVSKSAFLVQGIVTRMARDYALSTRSRSLVSRRVRAPARSSRQVIVEMDHAPARLSK